MEYESIAEVITQMLAERERTLGTIECGTDGAISRRLFDTQEGAMALGNSLVMDKAEQIVGIMALPRPQLKKAGLFSAKAARAAAREGTTFLGVHLCLAVWAPENLQETEKPWIFHVALNTGRDVIAQSFQHEELESGGQALDWLTDQALEMVYQALS